MATRKSSRKVSPGLLPHGIGPVDIPDYVVAALR